LRNTLLEPTCWNENKVLVKTAFLFLFFVPTEEDSPN